MPAYTVIAALLPALLYSVVVWTMRRHDRAIMSVLAPAIVWGAVVATSVTLLAQDTLRANALLVGDGGMANAHVIVLSPILEEALKAVSLLFLLRAVRLETALEGALLGAGVGLGFAATENLFSFTAAFAEAGMTGWLGAVATRTALTSVMHACSTAAAGVVAGHWAGRPLFDRWVAGPLLGYGVAVLVHMGFNGGLLAGEHLVAGMHVVVIGTLALVLVLVARWAVVQERQLLAKELLHESDEHGSLTRDEAHRVGHGVRMGTMGVAAARLALLRVRESRCPSPMKSGRRREIIALRDALASHSVID